MTSILHSSLFLRFAATTIQGDAVKVCQTFKIFLHALRLNMWGTNQVPPSNLRSLTHPIRYYVSEPTSQLLSCMKNGAIFIFEMVHVCVYTS